MPQKVEQELRKTAERKFPGDKERQDKYVYGTLNKYYKKQDGKWYKKESNVR